MSAVSKPYPQRTHKLRIEATSTSLSEQAKADRKNARCHQRNLQRKEQNIKAEALRIIKTLGINGKLSKEDLSFKAKYK